ncbi:MAG: hypothetical protein DRO06_02725 [Thermoproteota archaeon]|nr:MAG: hypothetical protein DRO06_02725 [Candidatus Korarchaeota archaeon]
MLRVLGYVTIVGLLFFGTIFLIAAAVQPWRAVVAFALYALAGLVALSLSRIESAKRRARRLEAELIRLVRAKGGRVTVEDVAVALRLTVDEAEALLESLVRRGLASIDMEETERRGVVVYSFPTLS